jgi:catechol 2,3-dioxygenase-like lactoylglutathione lyase family enzyme
VLGRFHEIGISTDDIRASVEFYERLGFTQAETNDTWAHPYGVLTDGRIHIGLHEHKFPSPSLTFVHADIAAHAAGFESRGIELSMRRTTDDVFNEIGFLDPAGQMVTVLEARTYSPAAREAGSLCGYFTEYSIPASDFETAQKFWEPLGFVATEEPRIPRPGHEDPHREAARSRRHGDGGAAARPERRLERPHPRARRHRAAAPRRRALAALRPRLIANLPRAAGHPRAQGPRLAA